MVPACLLRSNRRPWRVKKRLVYRPEQKQVAIENVCPHGSLTPVPAGETLMSWGIRYPSNDAPAPGFQRSRNPPDSPIDRFFAWFSRCGS